MKIFLSMKNWRIYKVAFFSLLLIAGTAHAQHDSLILKNNDIVVGEMKSLNNGVVTIETDYSKNDFTIEWSGIRQIYTTSTFILTLKDGTRLNGFLRSDSSRKKVIIHEEDGRLIETVLDDIVFAKALKSDFWSRFYASIGIGASVTKANNLRQITSNTSIGYLADKWQLDLYFNTIFSRQDSIADIKRTDAGISYKYFLQKDWFLSSAINFLSNTEQSLRLRTTGKLGVGKMIVHTNRSTLATGAGINYNGEQFTNSTPKRNSMEAFAGIGVNLFDIGDLDLQSNWYVYKSVTESGRWRSDFSFDAKYDLPHDFFIKLNVTLNYDNQPGEKGKEFDYIYGFTIGWDVD